MKKKTFKIIGVSILTVLLLAVGRFIYIYFTQPITIFETKDMEYSGEPDINKILSKEEVSEDIENVIDIIESTHPIFLEEVPEEYYKEKEKLLSISEESMSVGQLQNNISRYLSVLEDGHTMLWWQENQFLNIDWKYVNGKLMLLENSELTDKRVTKIGDVNIEDIIEIIEATFPAENYIAEAKNIEKYLKSKLVLEQAGVQDYEFINITVEGNGEEKKLQVEFNSENNKTVDYSIYSKKIDDNIAYIRLGICEVNSSLEKVIDDINNYLDSEIDNFIIDVEDNPGGNSTACTIILEALKITPGNYGSTIRFSKLAQEQRGYLRSSGSVDFKSNNDAVANEDINLYVIENENTFSSAQMLAVWVSDGNLGRIVGRPSSNKPSSFGDIICFQLENSKLKGSVSHKKWIRPDINKDKEDILEPDIYVEYGEDSVKTIIDEINSK